MDDNRSQQDDDQGFLLLSLELAVSLNHEALEYMLDGDENLAAAVLTEAVSILARTSPHQEGGFAQGVNRVQELPRGLTLLNVPTTYVMTQGQDVSLSAVSVIDAGSFSLEHGVGSAHRILVTITLYHTALVLHRRCWRDKGKDTFQLLRCCELCNLCDATIVMVPEMAPLKYLLNAIVGHLHTLFEFPAAA
jgi:hypothetical protein